MYVCKYWIASVIYKPEVSVCELCRESRHLVLSSKALIASISLFHAYVLSTHFINIAKHSLMYLWDCFVLGTHNNCIKRHSTWVANHLLSPPRLPIDKHYYFFFFRETFVARPLKVIAISPSKFLYRRSYRFDWKL